MIDVPELMDHWGISVNDCLAIKMAILHAIREGHIKQESAFEASGDVIAAFQLLDQEVFTRSESERKLSEEKRLTTEKK